MNGKELRQIMQKSFSQNKMQKKNRGVAVIFTLGILGLLTVMALGFASTALLNRKIADNTSSAEYARHIAKNIALARAKWEIMRTNIVSAVYCSSEISGDQTDKDFLYKMDTVLDGVEIYRVTKKDNDYNDAVRTCELRDNSASWQYVREPVTNRILGRYAYAVVPDSGMDPSVNLGTLTDTTHRYGISETELKLPQGSLESTNWQEKLTEPDGDEGKRKGKITSPNRWKSFGEIFAASSVSTGKDRHELFNDGISIRQRPDPETFWVDLNKDGKRTPNEMFLRFNMTRDWNTTTVDQLIGTGVTAALTLDNAGSGQSNTFIPWLKNWNHSNGTSWTADVMKKQIAANIIQYNRAADQPTVTDKATDADWLTDPPDYAGIGRHPMLNEIGFLIRVRSDVACTDIVAVGEDKITCTYTPTYYITVDAGAELIYPFGPASSLQNSEISFSGKISFRLRKFKRATPPGGASTDLQKWINNHPAASLIPSNDALNSETLDGDITDLEINLKTGVVSDITPGAGGSTTGVLEQMSGSGYTSNWMNHEGFKFSLSADDWNASPAYTKAGSFWMENKIGTQRTIKKEVRPVRITTPRLISATATAEEESLKIANAMAKRMTVDWVNFQPETVVLKYADQQRDIVKQLTEINLNTAKPLYLNAVPLSSDDNEKVWFVAYQTTDPLVNHYSSDWTTPTKTPERYVKQGVDWSPISSLKSDYPGTLYSDGSETDTSHVNSTISGKLPQTLLSRMTDPETSVPVLQETATNPAYTSSKRLSTSYIRHGQMKSLWELGFISRAEAFKTLNLAKTKIFEPSSSPPPTSIDYLQAGGFTDGDANILDQVKLSDSSNASDDKLYKYGKINLNSNNHNALSRLFNTDVNWYETLRTSSETDQFSTTGTASAAVCSASPCSGNTCLAHLLKARSDILPFSNRSDLLLDPEDTANFAKIPGYSSLPTTPNNLQNELKTAQTNLRNFLLKTSDITTLCKAEKEQYAARFMHLFSTEPVKRVYIIVLAQSIKDIGGVPALVDWNGDGVYSPTALTIPSDTDANMKKFLRTGYIRKKLYASGYEKIGSVDVDETISSTAIGTYNPGADKITGETKLIVEMQKDILTNTWKMTGYRYVE